MNNMEIVTESIQRIIKDQLIKDNSLGNYRVTAGKYE